MFNLLHQLHGTGPIILANHGVPLRDLLPLIFDPVQLPLQLIDIFTLRNLHLPHDLPLRAQLSVQALCTRQRLIDLVLKFYRLLLK